MRRRWLVPGTAAAVLLGTFGLPALLRQVPFFRVRQVELVGVRYLSPDTVLAALGIAPEQNVFDDTDAIASRAASVAGVVSARIERRLPGTLRVIVVEQVPVAFVAGGERLVAVDGDGRTLPYDPAASGLDLPLIAGADSLLVRSLAVVRFTDSTLFREVDGARRTPLGAVRLELGATQVLLAGVPAAGDVRAIAAVRQHLDAAGRRYRELDARYRRWIVVRRGLS